MSPGEFAGQAIMHALVAALVVEAVVRLWRVASPDLRLAFRLLALAFPVLVLPAFFFLVPARGEEWFKEGWALFTGSRWGEVTVWGVGVDVLGLALLSAAGLALFMADLLPFLAERLKDRNLGTEPCSDEPAAVVREVNEVAGRMGVAPPSVLFHGSPAPLLLCAGIRRPALVLSRGTIERLDGRERLAALGHEIAHLARRDPLIGWILMAARAVMFFNPAAQVIARAAVQEMEWRADDLAAQTFRDPVALAGALVKLSRAGTAEGSSARLLAAYSGRARAVAIEKRCRRLLDGRSPAPLRFGRLRVVLTGLALSLLLFFVV